MRPSAAPEDVEPRASDDFQLGARTLDPRDDGGGRRRGPRRALVAFLLTAVVGLVLVSAGSVLLSRRIASDDGLADAERTTTSLGQQLVGPILPDALSGTPGRFEQLQAEVADRMRDRSIEAVLVWDAAGRVLFCSDPTQIGVQAPPSDELLEAIHGRVASDVATGSEVRFAGEGTNPMLEVYVPISARGQHLALEAYYDTAAVDESAAELRSRIVPLALGGLVVLELVQIPVTVSLAGRARRQDAERSELMALSLDASERERRAIAADVHRGPVPHLAQVRAALVSLRSDVPAERQPLVDRLAGAVESAARSLSRLMVDLYPPGRGGPDLAAALENLATPLRDDDIEVSIEAAPLPKLSLQTSAAIYRTAKEAMINVAKHAGATHVQVDLEPAGDRRARAVRLCIVDDGVGFPPDALDRRTEGHLGLRLIADRVQDAGGTLELGLGPDGGASVTAVFPAVPGT